MYVYLCVCVCVCVCVSLLSTLGILNLVTCINSRFTYQRLQNLCGTPIKVSSYYFKYIGTTITITYAITIITYDSCALTFFASFAT